MKYPVLISLVLLFSAGILQGQSGKLDKWLKVDQKEGTIGSILGEISRKGGFEFSYNQDIPVKRQISLQYNNQTVRQFLDEIFEGGIYCIEYGNKILLRKKPVIPEVYTVTGKVVESGKGEPVPGVEVFIPGTDPLIGAVSDEQGKFRINVPLGMDVIRFSCLGYNERDLSLEESGHREIELTPVIHEIREVEVRDYTLPVDMRSGVAVSYITPDRLGGVEGASIEHALIGAAPGVYVVRNSGMPGASFQVRIRGTQSLICADPVYYLDGIPLQSALLHALSPHDISSMEINKDASSTALYGARAANGVVMLNSKQGKGDGLHVNFDYHIGVQQAWKKLELMDNEEFMDYAGEVIPDDTWLHQRDSSLDASNNWQDIVFHPAKTMDCHLSITGGNDRSAYYLGTGFYQQASIINELDLNRYSFKFGSDHRINRKWEFSQDISLAHIRHEGLNEGCFLNDHNNPILASLCMLPFSTGMNKLPDLTLWDSLRGSSLVVGEPAIPLVEVELTDNVRKNYALMGNLTSGVKLTRNLELQTLLGYELFYQNNSSKSRTLPVNIALTYNPVLKNNYKVLDLGIHIQNYLCFRETLAEYHDLEARVGFEYGQNENEWIPVSQSIANLADTAAPSAVNNPVLDTRHDVGIRNRAFLGSISYAFKSKYILAGSLRREVVSFEADTVMKDYADLYPSLSCAWIFLNRSRSPGNFMQFGKLRYAFGMAGNSPRLDYSFYSRFMRDMAYVYSFNSTGAITNSSQQRQANEHFYWEKTSAHNLGLELGFMQNRLFLVADLFYNRSYMGETSEYNDPLKYVGVLYARDLFGIKRLPLAELVNYGVEGQLNFKNAGRLIKWDISMNLCHLRNQILDVEEQHPISTYDPLILHRSGEAAGSFYGYKTECLFTVDDCAERGGMVTEQPFTTDENGKRIYAQPDARAGDYKFADMNGDAVINQEDKTILGNPYPDLSFGLYVNASYRQFDFTMFWQGVYGNEIYNATRLWLYNPYGSFNWTTDIKNSYRAPEYDENGTMTDPGFTDTELHRFDHRAENKNLRVSDFYIEDGSYLRLKNIQLGYTLNPVLTGRIHITKLRIFLAAQNLFTFTNYSGLDPEVGGWGIDCGIYPQPRTYYAGVSVEF